jgi:type II secretory pathway component PulC
MIWNTKKLTKLFSSLRAIIGPKDRSLLNEDDEETSSFWKKYGQQGLEIYRKTSSFLSAQLAFYFPKMHQQISLTHFTDNLFNYLLSPEKRADLHRSFILTTIVLFSYLVGKIAGLGLGGHRAPPKVEPYFASSISPVNIPQESFALVKTKNLFKTLDLLSLQKSKMERIKEIICNDANQVSAIPINLVNTIVLQSSNKSLATIQIRGQNELVSIHEGDNIQGLAEVGKIKRLTLVLKNLQTGDCELLINRAILDEKAGSGFQVVSGEQGKKLLQQGRMDGIEQNGNSFRISKTLIQQKMGDLENILTQAKAIQMLRPDGSVAFKIVEIVPGSIFSFLGLQDGDQITQINGKKLNSLNDVMNLLAGIQQMNDMSLQLVKDDGSEQTFEYNLVK